MTDSSPLFSALLRIVTDTALSPEQQPGLLALQLHEKRRKDGHLGITVAVAEATVDEGIAVCSDRLIAFLDTYTGELQGVLTAPGFVDAELDIGHFASTEYAAWSVTLPVVLLQKLASYSLDVTLTTYPSDPNA